MSSILRVSRQMVIPSGFMEVRAPKTAPVADWWVVPGKTCVAAYQAKGAASYAASLVNLANPGTYDAAPGVAPSWDTATGWTFNGTTQYLTTGVTPATGYTIIARYANLTQTFDRTVIGAGNTQHDGHEIRPMWINSVTKSAAFAHGAGWVVNNPGVACVLGLSGRQGYRNGATWGAVGGTATLTSNSHYAIGAKQFGTNTGRTFYFLGDVLAVAIYDTSLLEAEMLALSTAMAAL